MKRCGLLGKAISYSDSPAIHNEYYRKNNIQLQYEIFDMDEWEIEKFIKKAYENNIIGFNVTIPYKEKIIKYLDELMFPADKIKAVNTVVVHRDSLVGYNTDYFGFISSLEELNINLKDKKALIIGGGGAAKSTYYSLLYFGCKTIDIALRDIKKLDSSGIKSDKVLLLNSSNSYYEYDIIINCTPLGGVNYIDSSPIDTSTLRKDCIVYDLVYKPAKTKLIMEAEKAGCTIINGNAMLIHQAYRAAGIWANELYNKQREK